MGFAVIIARLSDAIGRKTTLVASWVMFGAFSLGAGLAKTLGQLIGFRVLQGLGGSGLYTMMFVVGPRITPLRLIGAFSAAVGIVLTIGSILGEHCLPPSEDIPTKACAGPVLGGVITQTSTWRWVYLFNVPCAGVGIVLCLVLLPNRTQESSESVSAASFRKTIRSIDFVGGILLLAASALLVFGLQEGGRAAYAWKSAIIISALTVSGISWVAFLAWILFLSGQPENGRWPRPILPTHIRGGRPIGPAVM